MSHMTDAMRAATANLAGDVEPHNDPLKSAVIVRFSHGWNMDETGRLYGLVAGDQGYAATHIVLQTSEVDATFAAACVQMSDAARDVLSERRRQIEDEGWSEEHDDEHSDGSLALAAACYAEGPSGRSRVEVARTDVSGGRGETPVWRSRKMLVPSIWPDSWSPEWWKPSEDRRRDLVRAGALILAEIERRDRSTAKGQEADARGDMGPPPRAGGTPPTQDWTVEDSRAAREILSYLGIGSDASLEPGADRRRDKVAAIICAAREGASHG